MLRAVKRGLVRIGCSVLSILRGHLRTLDYIGLTQTATEPIVRLLCHPSPSPS